MVEAASDSSAYAIGASKICSAKNMIVHRATISELQFQTVIGNVSVSGKFRLGRLRQFMRDVSEVGFLGAHARCDVERLLHAQVRRVWFVPQCVDDQNL